MSEASKKYTIEDVLSFNPCEEYQDGKLIKKAFGRRKEMTVLQATDPRIQKVIPAEDLVWFFTQPGVLEEKVRGLWIADCAERALKHYAEKYPDDDRPQKVIDTVRAYYNDTATAEDLREAYMAAGVAWAAARAVWSATGAALAAAEAALAADAADAAEAAGAAGVAWAAEAADAAARAARAAAEAAGAAADVERKWQVARLREILDGSFEVVLTNPDRSILRRLF